MLKPDAVERGLEEEILKYIDSAGLKIFKRREMQVGLDRAERLYAVHKGKPFYDGLIKFINSGPVVACIVEGDNAILKLRKVMGATDPRNANAGTIRSDLKERNVISAVGTIKNMVHGSDSLQSAEYEIPIFFPEEAKV